MKEAELEMYKRQSSQRGARLQLFREYLIATKQWEMFLDRFPGAAEWFNEEGVSI